MMDIVVKVRQSVDWDPREFPWDYLRGLSAAEVAERAIWCEMVNWCVAMAVDILGVRDGDDGAPSPFGALCTANDLLGAPLGIAALSKRKKSVADHATYFERGIVQRMAAARRARVDPIPGDPLAGGGA